MSQKLAFQKETKMYLQKQTKESKKEKKDKWRNDKDKHKHINTTYQNRINTTYACKETNKNARSNAKFTVKKRKQWNPTTLIPNADGQWSH